MTKTSRVTNVQTPGEQKPTDTPNTGAPAQPAATQTASTTYPDGTAATGTPPLPPDSPTPAVDLDALRAQIREEERINARRELGQQIEAAASMVGQPTASAQRSKGEYQAMRAADIDPATLTAPVLTRDGYLCPLPPEPKK